MQSCPHYHLLHHSAQASLPHHVTAQPFTAFLQRNLLCRAHRLLQGYDHGYAVYAIAGLLSFLGAFAGVNLQTKLCEQGERPDNSPWSAYFCVIPFNAAAEEF
jgi:hypothetical protein